MYAKALAVAAAALLAASPAFAAHKKHAAADTVPAGWENANGPIPYSELAAADAKINGTGKATHAARKHHAAKKTASATGSAGATTTEAAPK